MTTEQSDPVIRELAAAMTAANPKDRWAFAKAHIQHRLTGCPDCGCSQAQTGGN